ncbi:Carbohydrate esterase family 4 protein [Mycena indigotica]|uniref:chitin deacetylase n=1 Tax=Mycena indigotica TaxID=2126181 RepID=A0A8H6SEQ6_9AGAR|nr:Carbohydrate esterase family 4 protein [Mycena indigotica]KAF7296997.1 Carbohydrate esterase family 4 protein [Mycena indigotica]
MLARSTTLFFLGLTTLAAAGPTTEAEASALLGEAECQPYGYQPVTNAILAKQFPPIWVPVPSLQNDTDALAKFRSIEANIPKIAPKGENGVPSNTTVYDRAADPDCWWTQAQCVQPKAAGVKPDIFNVPEPRTLGYGFDDGPYCGHNAFYNYLSQKNQKATMFFVGSNVLNNPLQAQRAVADGHEICVHSWSHAFMTAFNNEQAYGELYFTMKAIKLVTGYTPKCWRPPRGDVDDRIRFIAQSLGLDNVMWKYDSFDWEKGLNGVTEDTVRSNYEKLISDASTGVLNTAGAIILAHELSNYTMQVAVDYYPKLAAAFDHIVPIAVAFNKTQPYAETDLTMPDFKQYIAQRPASSSNSSSSNNSNGKGDGKNDSSNSTNGKTSVSGASAAIVVRPLSTGGILLATLAVAIAML